MSYAAEQRINIKASAWTIGVHIVLLLLFLFVKYGSPVTQEPLPEMGMEVNLGTSDDGSGTDQPMIAEDPAPDNATAARTSASQQSAEDNNDILKTEEPDAPVINNTPAVAKKPVHNPTENKKATKQTDNNKAVAAKTTTQRPRYVYNGGTGKGGNSAAANMPGTSEGNTHGTGDRGVPGGTPGAPNYTGIPGRGNGISHNLSGRSIVAFPPPDADFKEGGKVVIRITVNREGQIVNKQVKSANNAEIRAIALRKADKIKFNKSDSAPEEQFGDITFVFKTRS